MFEKCHHQRTRGSVRSHCGLWLRGTMLIVMAAVAVQTLATTAAASCGDYLDHRSRQTDSATHRFDSGPIGQVPQAPCRGPGCRQAPHAPAAPSVPLQPVSTVDLALPTEPLRSHAETASDNVTLAERLLFSRSIAPLERPPRCS
jgi:hypothetical protein